MISSACRTCDNRYGPKDRCIKFCEKIKEIQNAQYFMGTPPYGCNDGIATVSCKFERMLTPDD